MKCTHSKWDQGICYMCKADSHASITLADGCSVPLCSSCLLAAKEAKAAWPGAVHQADRYVRGGDSMRVEKGSTGGNNLKVEFIEERKITSLKIVDEGNMVTYEAKNADEKSNTRLVIGVNYEGRKDGDPDRWSLNNKSRNALIDIWGDDTKNWIGKTAEIALSGDGEYRHITVDILRTR